MRSTLRWMNKTMRRSLSKLFFMLAVVAFMWLTPVAAQSSQPQPPTQTGEFVPISQLPPQDQLPAAPLLVTAYAFVWVVLFGYVVSVARRLTKVQHEVERLEADIKRGTRA